MVRGLSEFLTRFREAPRRLCPGPCVVLTATALMAFSNVSFAAAGSPPEIRITASNAVPACVTPDRLMTFLKARNHNFDARFKDIAAYYKQAGETWHVRWDYAFYQMAIETNFLTYKRPDGHWGDVDPKQNNFAGIGTTGGGVPGDKFPDVKTGVLGQIQHLVAYSGEHLAEPVAARTQLKQDDIILESQKLGRPVRFSDLARRWAVDPKYGASIEWVADAFRSEHCRDGEGKQAAEKEILPWATPATAAPVPVKPLTAKKIALPISTSVRPPVVASAPAVAAKPQNAVRTVWVSSPRPQAVPLPTPPVLPPVLPPALPQVLPQAVPEVVATLPAAPAQPATTPLPVAKNAAPAAIETAFTTSPLPPPPSGLGVKPLIEAKAPACRVTSASYGGKKTVLVRATVGGEDRYTALTVLDGFEKSMTASFLKSRAPDGVALGEFPDQRAALNKAHELCPSSKD